MIFTGFHSNTTRENIYTALRYLLVPTYWKKIVYGNHIFQAEELLKETLKVPHVHTFDSGRSALEIALKALGVQKGDEVLVQAYTCIVVINAIKFTGAVPVYVDITDNFVMDIEDVKKKITPKTKAIIAQHTFGFPADMSTLTELSKQHSLHIIEDCAHVIGGATEEGILGTIGDIGMLSFGSDKAISCSRGGALITKDESIAQSIDQLYRELPLPRAKHIVPHLLNYPLFTIGKTLYPIIIGRALLAFCKKYSITGRVITDKEKKGERGVIPVSKLANSLSEILIQQLKNLKNTNKHRTKIADIYRRELHSQKISSPKRIKNVILVRYPIIIDQPLSTHAHAKKKHILLGNWYDTVIAPKDSDKVSSGYVSGSCVRAEYLAKHSINLPTHHNISISDAHRIIEVVYESI